MNILEAFDELNQLNEKGPGGQKTYKQFLIYLAEFLGIAIPANYDYNNWVLHHLNCKHDENNFENLVLMNKSHPHSICYAARYACVNLVKDNCRQGE